MNVYDMVMEEIVSYMVECFGMEKSDIKPESLLVDDLDLDSLDLLELLMKLEERFGVVIPDEKMNKVRTVRNVCEIFSEALNY
jgi:acyl carrier protein